MNSIILFNDFFYNVAVVVADKKLPTIFLNIPFWSGGKLSETFSPRSRNLIDQRSRLVFKSICDVYAYFSCLTDLTQV